MRRRIRQLALPIAGLLALPMLAARAQSRADTNQVTSTVTLTDSLFPVTGTASPVAMLAGKVSGLTVLRLSGAPGSLAALQLRARTDFATETPPLYVVDGITLSPFYPLSVNDIEALDIESFQIVKGAAAGAAYGFRGGSGVIVINTRRGRSLPGGKLHVSARSEFGPDLSYGTPAVVQAHAYRVNSAGQYVNAAGAVISRDQRVLQANGIRENRYTVPTYNHSDQFFRRGLFNTQAIAIARNGTSTNFNFGYTRNDQPGNVLNADGVERHTFRLNGDYGFANRFRLALSSSYTRSTEEPADTDFGTLSRFEADVNLLAPGTGRVPYIAIPDPVTQVTSPFFRQLFRTFASNRARAMVNLHATYNLLSWLTADAGGSYDRGIMRRTQDIPLGQLDAFGRPSSGLRSDSRDSLTGTQARAGISANKSAGKLAGRASVHVDWWRDQNAFRNTTGTDFAPDGTPRTKSEAQTWRNATTQGLTANAGVVYDNRYTVDVLGRRDRNTGLRSKDYGRASVAWAMHNEAWFPDGTFDLLKLRLSAGTAGSDARGVATSTSGGLASFSPNLVSEREVALDGRVNNRVAFSLAYSSLRSRLTNVVTYTVPVGAPIPAFTEEYDRVSGQTMEAVISAQLIKSTSGAGWDINLVADRARSRIVDFRRACFSGGLDRLCNGITLGSMWGSRLVTDRNALPSIHANSAAAFDVNDEGYVVPVGAGNSWRDGKAKNLWGSTISVDGRTYPWGLPIVQRDNNGLEVHEQIGDGNPDLQFGVQNTVRYRALTLYAQITGQIGGDTYNNAKQSAYNTGTHEDADQTGKPDELRKPVTYFRAVAGSNTGYLPQFAERATHARLAEASVGYRFTASKFAFLRRIGAEQLQVDLVGRNLFTLTGYSGANVQGVSSAIRFDDIVYPQTRTFTLATRVVF